MANLRITFVGTAGNVIANGPDLSPAQENLFIDWLWEFYAPVDANGVKLTRNAANEAQAFRNYAAAMWKGTRSNVVRWKHELDKSAVQAPTVPEE